jgi:hypothetical protein
MAGVIENYSKFEVFAVLRYLQAEGGSESDIHHREASIYGKNVFSWKERKCLMHQM